MDFEYPTFRSQLRRAKLMSIILWFGVIVAVLIFTVYCVKIGYDFLDGVFIAFIGGILAAMVFGVSYTVFSAFYGDERRDVEQLQALSVDSSIHGSFFLGSGSVNEEPVFYYYVKNLDGSFYLDYQSAEDVTIVEGQGRPRLVQDCFMWSPLFGFNEFDPNTDVSHQAVDCDNLTFFVPKNSITQSYNLSLPGSQ